jgi:hypothetical protein
VTDCIPDDVFYRPAQQFPVPSKHQIQFAADADTAAPRSSIYPAIVDDAAEQIAQP